MKNNKKKLFKWVGGKKWLSDVLNSIFEKKLPLIDIYVEPFCGGLGSVFANIHLFEKYNIQCIHLNDINKSLIDTYISIKENHHIVLKDYMEIEKKYSKKIPAEALKLTFKNDKILLKKLLIPAQDFFYEMRREFNYLKLNKPNSKKIPCLFIFLAQHSFNGLYRENLNGEYNSPYNWECNIVNHFEKESIFNYYNKIFNQFNIKFTCESVFEFLNRNNFSGKKVLYYIDPPYLNEKSQENKYNKDHFGYSEQCLLLKNIKKMDNVIFSNHYLSIFERFCLDNGFIFNKIYRSNIMNSKSCRRYKKVPEILAYK